MADLKDKITYIRALIQGGVVGTYTALVASYVSSLPWIGSIGILTTAIGGGALIIATDLIMEKIPQLKE